MKINVNKITTFLVLEHKSREWLAGALSCSVDTIKRLMRGQTAGTEIMVELSNLMGCSVNELFITEFKKKAPRGR